MGAGFPDEEWLPGSRRERAAYNDLRVLWPPAHDLDREPDTIRQLLEAEYKHGGLSRPKMSLQGARKARKAIMVSYTYARSNDFQ